MRIPRNPSPTRVTGAVDDENQLTGYNITVFKGIKPPKVLADFVSRLTESRHQEPSPHAQSIIGTQKAALTTNEITAQIKMEEHVLFRGETYPDGIPGLTLQKQVNLVKDFLPDPPYPAVPALWGSLALPQPDSCIGYITAMEAAGCTPVLTMPLTKEEDAIAAWYISPLFNVFN
jgi:hypothetical protein